MFDVIVEKKSYKNNFEIKFSLDYKRNIHTCFKKIIVSYFCYIYMNNTRKGKERKQGITKEKLLIPELLT